MTAELSRGELGWRGGAPPALRGGGQASGVGGVGRRHQVLELRRGALGRGEAHRVGQRPRPNQRGRPHPG